MTDPVLVLMRLRRDLNQLQASLDFWQGLPTAGASTSLNQVKAFQLETVAAAISRTEVGIAILEDICG